MATMEGGGGGGWRGENVLARANQQNAWMELSHIVL